MAWDPAKHPRDPRTGRFVKAGAALAALRGESGTSAPAVKFPKTAAKRAGTTDPAVVREKAFALVDAADTDAARRVAAGLKGKQLQAVADALGVTLYGRTVDEKRSQLVQSTIGTAFNSAAIRFSVEGDRGDTAARRAELAVERERFLRDYRNRTRQRVIDNTGGAAGAPTYGRATPTGPPRRVGGTDPATVRGIPIAQIADAVNADTTREAANSRIEGLTVPQLRALAAHMGVPLRGKSKEQMRRDISSMGAAVLKAQSDVFRTSGTDSDTEGLMAQVRAASRPTLSPGAAGLERVMGGAFGSAPGERRADSGGGKVLQFPGAGARRRGKARPRRAGY